MADEFQKVGLGDGGGRLIGQRMIVQPVMVHHGGVQDQADLSVHIIDQREGGDRARPDAQGFPQKLRFCEGEAGRPQAFWQAVQPNISFL